MQRDSLSLFLSLIALTLSIFYFLSFYSFRSSTMIRYDNENVYLNSSNTYLCDDVNDKNTCKYLFYSNKMINLGVDNDDNNLFLNKNTMLCDDVNDINTCTCLSNKCDISKKLYHITLLDKMMAFSENKYGMMFGARVIPTESLNTFTFSSWINISVIDINKWRSILVWQNPKTNKTIFAILISPNDWSTCSAKIDIRIANLSVEDSKDLYGTFNVDVDRGHCVRDTHNYYFKWFHFVLVGKGDVLKYYINGNLMEEQQLTKSLELGNSDDIIYLGGSPNHSGEGILLSKTKWYSKPLNETEINILYKEGFE